MGGEYYVYVIFRPDTGEPCYVGKGKNRRWKQHRKSHNAWLRKIYAKYGDLPITKVREDLTNDDATITEIALIAVIGRHAHGGPLVNMTDGGEGTPGYVFPEHVKIAMCAASRLSRIGIKTGPMPLEQRMAISRAKTGVPQSPEACMAKSLATKGKPKSETHKKAIGLAKLGKPLSEKNRAIAIASLKKSAAVRAAAIKLSWVGRVRSEKEKAAHAKSRGGLVISDAARHIIMTEWLSDVI